MNRQRIFLILGVILGLLAVAMVYTYIKEQEQKMEEKYEKTVQQTLANQAAVLVAKVEIPRGVEIEPDMLETKVIPNQYVQPQAVSSLDRIAGMVTLAPISEGEQITLSKLTYPKQLQKEGGALAELTPVGKRAVTISVDNIASVAGMVKPGDYVDVIAMLPIPVQTPDGKTTTQVAVMPLFQNVLVLAVGQKTSAGVTRESRYRKEEEKTEPSPLITLALGPQEASLVAFVQEQGKLRLVLRSPADSRIETLSPASWDTLFQYISSQLPQPQVKPEVSEPIKPVEAETRQIEIYRGLKKDTITLTK